MINIDDYSGTDTQKLQSALAYAATLGRGRIHFSGKTYILTARITIPDVPIVFEGEGGGVTELKWTCANGGIYYTPTQTYGRELELYDLKLSTSLLGGGIAIEASWPEQTGTYGKSLTLQDVVVRGATWSNAWTTGVKLIGARNAHICRCSILGCASNRDAMESGIYVTSGESSCGIYLDHTHIQLATTGFRVAETTAYGPEGIRLNACNIVSVNRGVHVTTGEPLLNVGGGTHISADYRCLEIKVVRSTIQNCYLALTNFAQTGKGGIFILGGSKNVNVHDCSIIGNPATAGNGIVVFSSSSGCNIHDCSFFDWTTGVWLQSNTTQCRCHDHYFENCTNQIINQGTGNIVS